MTDAEPRSDAGKELTRRMQRARGGKPFYQFVGPKRGEPGMTDRLAHQHALPTTGTPAECPSVRGGGNATNGGKPASETCFEGGGQI